MNKRYASILLFVISNSIHAEELMIVAHRGASRDAPENTIPAFLQAWAQGADAIEGDFQLTKDGHIVCIHDKTTERVAQENLSIKASTLEALRRLDVGAHHGEKYRGTVMPTISEVFATIPETKKIYIEIKCGGEIIPELLTQIERAGLRPEQIVFICFDPQVIQSLKTRAPQYKASWLSGFKQDPSGQITPSLATVLETLRQIQADGFSSSKDLIDALFINRVMQEGFEYHVWTVDDVPTARRFKEWGATSITTNTPGSMRSHLAESGVPAVPDQPES